MNDFLTALATRRSIYAIRKTAPISDEAMLKLIEQAILHSPSAFNMQSARVVLLLGAHHDRLWSITLEALRKIVPAGSFAPTEQKIQSFADGYGTVLYFDDTAVTNAYAEKFAAYKAHFPTWAQQANGMLQMNIWTLLEESGLGVSLQHYNPLIDAEVKTAWEIPTQWQLIAQMPFGAPVEPPKQKAFLPLSDRIRIYK